MPARFELIGKTAATITAIDILCLKLGQTDVQPAVCLSIKVALPNTKLAMLDPTLQRFLYEKDGPASPNTNTLAGIEPVSDLPDLTAAAKALGAIGWEYEQTGCKLKIYSGASGHANLTLKDGTVRKMKLDPAQGGTVEHNFQFYTAAGVDAEMIGELGIMKSLERDIELTAPEIISQQKTLIQEPETPEEALARTQGNGGALAGDGEVVVPGKGPDVVWPFPTSGHDNANATTVTVKPSRRPAAH